MARQRGYRTRRSPESLANLLEGAGPLALERAGAILAERSFDHG
jgi:hypothetical protein